MEYKSNPNTIDDEVNDSLKPRAHNFDETVSKMPAIEFIESVRQHSNRNVTSDVMDKAQYLCSTARHKSIDMVAQHGFKGTEVDLFMATYFSKWKIYQYSVTIQPEIELRSKRIALLPQLLPNLGDFIYDGMHLFTTNKLQEKLISYETTSQEAKSYTITLKQTGILQMNPKQSLQVLNFIFQRCLKFMELKEIQDKYFKSTARINRLISPRYTFTPSEVQVVPTLLHVRAKNQLTQKQTVYDILQNCKRNSKDYRKDFRRLLVGAIVSTIYSKRTFRVDDVDFEQTPKDYFIKNSARVSFLHYYYYNYNLRISDCNQPLLIYVKRYIKDKRGVDPLNKFIPEFCFPVGLSDDMISSATITQASSGYTPLNVSYYKEHLMTINKQLNDCEDKAQFVPDWSAILHCRQLKVERRFTAAKYISLQYRNKISADAMADWSNVFKNYSRYWTPSCGLHRWAVITFKKYIISTQKFIHALQDTACLCNTLMLPPKITFLTDSRNYSYVRAMENCLNHDPQLIICVVENSNSERDACIKKKSYMDRAVPNIILNIHSKDNETFANLVTRTLFKINSKLGFSPWMIDIPLSDLMTIGYSTYKSNTLPYKCFAALVATMDLKKNPTLFDTVTEITSNSNHAQLQFRMMTKALRKYLAEHHHLPSRILFYHYCNTIKSSDDVRHLYDGAKKITRALDDIYECKRKIIKPKFTYVVVSNHISAWCLDVNGNPIADAERNYRITSEGQFRFFLVPQNIRSISVQPTSYDVLYSTLDITADQLQNLTYKMCNVYYTCMSTNGIPAVCLYASKLLYLISNALNKTKIVL